MDSKELSPGKFALNYGLILGLILVIIGIYMYATNMIIEGKQWPMFIYYAIFPVFIIYTISQYKKRNSNTLLLIDALKVGVATAVISAIVYGVYGLVLNYVIDPDFMGRMLEATKEKLYENPQMTEEMIETSMKWVEKFSNPLFGIAMWLGLSAIFGLIYSLIGGLVMKKEA